MWIILIFHLFLCAALYLLMHLGILRSQKKLLIFVFLIPLFGIAVLAINEIYSRGNKKVKKEAGIEKLKINDEIYRSILMEEQEENIIVPLQEALILNDASVRRELMMKIMYDDTSQYVDTLKTARMNNDTEVVHYATTAMVEVQKEYDLKLQQLDKEYRENPEEMSILKSYLDLLGNYIASGLLEGNMLHFQRRKYQELLEKIISLQKEEDSITWFTKKAENELALKEYEAADHTIEEIISRWPDQEKGYLLRINLSAAEKKRESIKDTLDEINKYHIYLSSTGKNVVRFWQEEGL